MCWHRHSAATSALSRDENGPYFQPAPAFPYHQDPASSQKRNATALTTRSR